MKNKKPLLSIITVVYNGQNTIKKTVESVLNQSFIDYQYIIIDGASSDSTLSVLEIYTNKISKIISEPDAGIYDAMNKGIAIAEGEYIHFLNADDCYYNNDVLKNISLIIKHNPNADLYHGSIMIERNEGELNKIDDPFSSLRLRLGVMPPHPGMFLKNEVLKKNKFSSKYRSSGDFDLLCRLFPLNLSVYRFNFPVVLFACGGISSNPAVSYVETSNIIKKYFGFFFYTLYFVRKFYIQKAFKKILK